MALKRKKRDNEGRCSFCKKVKTRYTAHGGFVEGGGRRVCDSCYEDLKIEEGRLIAQERNWTPSEADNQTWMKL